MSNLLKRALKFSIAPAIIIIASKVIGILVLNAIYGLDLQIGNDLGQSFSTQLYVSSENDALYLNSITDAITLAVIALPLFYMVLKTSILQDSQKNPRTVVKLTKANLLKWITKDDVSFLKTFIWTAYLWIISGLIVANTLQGKTYIGIGVAAGVCALMASWGVLRTFEIESNKVYPE